MKIECRTLYDITRTDVHSRRFKLDSDLGDSETIRKRGQQSNFETIIQVISMRAQPEEITTPEKSMVVLGKPWGVAYANRSKIPMWTFKFTIDNIAPFDNGVDPLGNLLEDCRNVPMITRLDEWIKLGGQLSVDDQYRNIAFRILQ